MLPSFLQFLDSVWQVYKDVPDAFEFNELFLIFLADQAFFGKFGTFLVGIDRDVFVMPGENLPNLASIFLADFHSRQNLANFNIFF